MGRWILALVLLGAGPAALAEPQEKIELRVLYAGVKDDPRTAEFVAFLGETFAKAEAIALEELSAVSARAFDVVVVDSPSPYKGERKFEMPRAPALGDDYRKPTILLGAAGGAVLNANRTLKLNWL
jgi:hypothetical protein